MPPNRHQTQRQIQLSDLLFVTILKYPAPENRESPEQLARASLDYTAGVK